MLQFDRNGLNLTAIFEKLRNHCRLENAMVQPPIPVVRLAYD